MEPSIVHEQQDDFGDRNSFLYFVVGLVSISRRLMAYLSEADAPVPQQPNDSGETASVDDNPSDLLI